VSLARFYLYGLLTFNWFFSEFPKNGTGVGPGIPSFLNTVKGAIQDLEEKDKYSVKNHNF